eukprot:c18914_g1_i1 orf=2-892(-)
MRDSTTQLNTVTGSQAQKKGKRRRVFFKLSHHALGVFKAADNPLSKKPRLARVAMDAVEEQAAEEEDDEEDEEKDYRPTRREDEVLKPHSSADRRHVTLFKPLTPKAKPKSYLEKLQSRLSGGQFRMLNERLYTSSGNEAFEYFKEDPTAFQCYHVGYQEQMSRWPSQPLDAIINWLKKKSASLVVADFGCGNGKLAKSVKNRVFSLDLVASDETIIACNMAHTPLKTHSVDVTVFCLSLMGTDYSSFLTEAHRVLKPRGTLLIAEVRSRFDPNNGGADPAHFIKALNTLGFLFVSK